MTANEAVVKSRPQRLRGRPRPEEVAAIEHRLLDVALAELLEHGYGGTSMNRIVKVAGISKTTLYSRFPSKEALFRAIIHQQIDQVSPLVALHSYAGPQGLEPGLKAYANSMLEISLRGDVLGVNRLIYSESHRFPELGAAAAERTALGIARIARFIEDCGRAGGIACRDPEAAAAVFILMLRGWYVNVILTNREVSAAEQADWVERSVRILLTDQAHW